MIRKIVVTGATSSLGTALIDLCVKNNIEVLAIANPGSKNIARINKSDNVIIKECSLEALATFAINNNDIQKDYDAFFHLAWAATAGDAARNMLMPQALNIQYSLDAVNLAEELGCKAFIGSGSQAEYGRTNKVLTEELEAKPETAYGMAKLCAGQMTRLMCKGKGIKHIWPRILSAYGPNCQPRTVINYTLTELLLGNVPSLSKGEQIWDFIYTGDVAKALLLLAEKGMDGEIYLIGSGEADKLSNYLSRARDVINPDLPLGLGEKEYGENTVMHLACDITKLKNDTGFEIETDFETGILSTIEWIKKEVLK